MLKYCGLSDEISPRSLFFYYMARCQKEGEMPPKTKTNTDGTTTTDGDGKKPDANTQDPKNGGKPKAGEGELTYDTWVGEQPENVQKMLEGNTSGLKSALESERDARKGIEKDLRAQAKKAEGDAKTDLEAMADNLAAADQKADFYVDAQVAGISNLKLAYTVAISDDLIDGRGRVNFERMKKDYPELFGTEPKTPKGHGGSGNNPPAEGLDMNKLIRKAAGK